MQRPARPGSLLTGHRVRKTKHVSRQKLREKRPKEDKEEEAQHEGDDAENSDSSPALPLESTSTTKKPKQHGARTGKRARKLDALVPRTAPSCILCALGSARDRN